MIRWGRRIRLTALEVERFARITGIEPVDVRTLDDLDTYVTQCKARFWGVSRETQFLHWLLDQERSRCLCGL